METMTYRNASFEALDGNKVSIVIKSALAPLAILSEIATGDSFRNCNTVLTFDDTAYALEKISLNLCGYNDAGDWHEGELHIVASFAWIEMLVDFIDDKLRSDDVDGICFNLVRHYLHVAHFFCETNRVK